MANRSRRENGSTGYDGTESGPELIVIAKSDAELRAKATEVASAAGAGVSELNDLLSSEQVRMEPLFHDSEERLKQEAAELEPSSEVPVPDLSVYYRIPTEPDRMEGLAERIRHLGVVEGAYVQPPSAAPVEVQPPPEEAEETRETTLNDMAPKVEEAPPASPNFQSRQGYLGAAPEGIDALWAHTQRGGRGYGVRMIDLEWGWRFTHEDLRRNQGGVLAGANSSSDNHGTAVLGEIGGDLNTFGILGIAPDCRQSAVSFTTLPTATAIRTAANRLRRGDIMLLEIHRAGPNSRRGGGQFGYIAIEWWPADYDAICYAVARGVIVVEAAGNGFQNLDDPVYDRPQAGFPASWSNPFRRGARDSGAILVGAGAPPPGTHGRDHGPDRSRLAFSNYGQAVDAQGWGREVTTCGYGDLQGGRNRDLWYTDRFSGTSSASPIVVGALASTQGVLRARGQTPMSPTRARALLRATGSPQTDAPGRPRSQRIGNRPNLRQLIPRALSTRSWIGVQFRGTVPANRTVRWFTYNWPAQWHVDWTVVPTTPDRGARQIRWHVEVERASHGRITYWIVVTNQTATPVQVEGRYAVHGET
jgi:hypothetical protein